MAIIAAPKSSQWKPTHDELMIIATLSILSLMVSLDASIIVTSLSAIVRDLNSDTTHAFWVGTSYLLANAVAMPSIASSSDIFGRPACLFVSVSLFTIGSLLCCLARTINLLLAGRCFQGFGGGGIMILSLVIFTDIIPLRYRPKWYGTVLGSWALGTCGGPTIGGAFAQYTTWRWVFYLMFPFCGLGLVLIPFIVRLKPKTTTMVEKLRKVDWLGSFFFILSATLFLVAISWGGVQYSWSSTQTLVPLCIGAAGLVWTSIYESVFAKHPFLHLGLFRNVSSIATYTCGVFQGLILYGQLYYIPFFFLSVKGYTPVYTGLVLLPITFTLVPGSIVTGVWVTRTGNYGYPICVGWAMTTVASGLTILWGVDTPASLWATTLVILGLGHGAILNAQNFATQALCKPREEGLAAAMYGFLRQFGMALGVGVGASAFQNTMALKLGWEGMSKDIATQSEAFIAELSQLPDDAPFKVRVLDAYVYGFHGVYIVYASISGLALIISLLIRQVDMDREIYTEHTLAGREDIKGGENKLDSNDRD